MKFILSFIFLGCSILSKGQASPVIIELFTSQGCSSCPAADQNLTDILKNAEENNLPVYGLSFHVDYWNYIGWKDPYSQKAFTDRQQEYSQELQLNGIYTPQMVVNGEKELVGSNMDKARQFIVSALKEKNQNHLTVSNVMVENGKIKFDYLVDQVAKGEWLRIAIVEKSIENFVSRGENSGKKLHHDNVVRIFKSVELKREGSSEIPLPEIDIQKLALIVFVQESSGKIVTASRSQLAQ